MIKGKPVEAGDGKDMTKQDHNFTHLLGVYAERSSAVGPNHIKSSPHIFGKVMWVIILLAAVGITAYQTYEKINKYYQYDVKVETQLIFNRELFFPAVTVCNMNPYRKNVMAMKSPKLFNKMDMTTTGDMATMAPSTSMNTSGMKTSDMMLMQAMQTDSMQVGAWDQKMTSQPTMVTEMAMVETMLTEVNQMDDATRKTMGHMLETMLLRCSFNGAPCNPKDFHHFLNWRHGNCFTFNSGWGNTIPVITRNGGSDYGLSMSFYLQTDEYVDALTETVGLKVILSDQNLIPFPEDEGTIISAGAHTQITIQRLEVQRAGAPATPDCQSVHDNVTNYYNRIVAGLDYQEKTCWRTCLQTEINERCGCRYAPYPGPNIRICMPKDPIDANCTSNALLMYRNGGLSCSCLAACDEVTYNTASSSATWPAQHSWDNLRSKFLQEFPYLRDVNMTATWAKDNLAKVDIFYPSLNFEQVAQSLAYSVLDLLSDIGGILGFWIGLSIASLLELVEFAIEVMVLLFSRMAYRQSAKVNEFDMTRTVH